MLASTIVPHPIAWVVSRDANGIVTAVPFSFFNLFSDDPPVVCLGIMGRNGVPKDTPANIRATGKFVVNLVSEQLARQMNITGFEFDHDVDELKEAGLSTVPSSKIGVLRIAESPVTPECVPLELLEMGNGRVIIAGRVVAMYIREDAC